MSLTALRPRTDAHDDRVSANSTVAARSRWLVAAAAGVLLLVLAVAGWLLSWRVLPWVLVGVVLVVVQQVTVLRVPWRRVWARDSVRFVRAARRRSLVIVVLGAVLAAAFAQAVPTWVNDSWLVVLLAAALMVAYVVSRRVLVTVAVAAALVLGTAAVSSPRLATLRSGDQQLLAQLDEFSGSGYLGGFHDLVVAEVDLNQPSQPVRQAAIGSLTAASPMEIGSMTKAMTGLVIADAVHRGELSLASPVSTYLPVLAGSAAGAVTLGDVVTHHAGYPEFGAAVLRRAAWLAPLGRSFLTGDVADLLQQASQAKLSARGTYAYSSLGAAVAGQAVAAAAGMTYPELMRTRLFVPLGMFDTTIPAGTSPVAGGRSASGLREAPWLMNGSAPAGAAVSTAHDLTLLATALLHGTAPGMAALTPIGGSGQENTQVGMLWQVSRWNNGQTVSWHNGQTAGYTAYLGLDRANAKAVIVLCDVARDDVTDVGVRLLADTPAPPPSGKPAPHRR